MSDALPTHPCQPVAATEEWFSCGGCNKRGYTPKVFGYIFLGVASSRKMCMESFLKSAIEEAVNQAKKGLAEGGIPIGAVVLKGKTIVGRGHNRRLQNKDLTAHGETECFRNAGENLFDPTGTILITTLSPCRMCAGATQIAGIERVIILDQENYDDGQAEPLDKAGIKVEILPHEEMIQIFKDWRNDPKNKDTWFGDGCSEKVLLLRKGIRQ